jgi:aryl-alcohol dehydrogenase
MLGARSIRAAVAVAPRQPFAIETLKLAAPKADELLVRVVTTGICHTDIGKPR